MTAARDQLIVNHMGLAVTIARRYHISGHSEDARQEAMLGLIEAADRYDSTRNDSFSRFAYRRIRGQALDYCRRSPMLGNARIAGYQSRLDRYQQTGEEIVDVLEGIVNTAAPPDARPIAMSVFKMVDRHCRPRTAAMIRLWCHDWTMQEIADSFGITESRVHQIVRRGLDQVRRSGV